MSERSSGRQPISDLSSRAPGRKGRDQPAQSTALAEAAIASSTPTSGQLVNLQRVVGNRATGRLLSDRRDSKPQVQRLFKDPSGGRISDGDAFSVHGDNKTVFATSAAIATSNQKLASVNALVKLKPTGLASGSRLEVAPALNADAVTERLQGHGRWKRLIEKNTGDEYKSFADCFQTSATVSGLHPGNEKAGLRKGSFDEVPAVMRFAWGSIPVCTTQAGKELGANNAGARAAVSFYLHAFPEFGLLIKDAEGADGLDKRLANFKDNGKTTFSTGQRLYDAILKKPDIAKSFVTRYGINEAVAPNVGTALVNVGDADEVSKTDGKWNMHWAGVIIVDGADYLTLENFALEFVEMTVEDAVENTDLFKTRPVPLTDVVAVDMERTKFVAFTPDGKVADYMLENPRGSQREKTDIINGRWVFKAYGKEADSFHAKAGADSHATAATMTLPVSRGDV